MLIRNSKSEEAADEQKNNKVTQSSAPPSYEDAPKDVRVPLEEGFSAGGSTPGLPPRPATAPVEQPLHDAAQRLQAAIEEYKAARKELDGREDTNNTTREMVKRQEDVIFQNMREMGDNSSDQRVRDYYHWSADRFRKGESKEKNGVLNDMGRGLTMIIAAPIINLGAASVRTVADILLGLGLLMKGTVKTCASAISVVGDRKQRRKKTST
ncbi:hypothetical protein AAF712_006371 [Marasmius tenuissimus]|uniref:Uncharacterized protein n=1 Tax=Marasmius tenuissimus TaxID=585030 RepID=A0ABR2ZYW5_9AGAR|nr:hypothetical protein PM082_003465 [Marasmius tenuissimus]